MFLILAGLHVPTPLRYFVIAAAAVTVIDNSLTALQRWRLRIPGARLQWADCALESHRRCTAQCVAKDPGNVDVGYDLVKLSVPATSLSPGSFFYLRSGWRSCSGPMQILWYDEGKGCDIVRAHYLQAEDTSIQRDIRSEVSTIKTTATGTKENNIFFLIKRRDSQSHFKFLNCCTRLEGPYERRQTLDAGSSDDITWFFAADDGVILALSYVKHMWTSGIHMKLNLYTTNAALMAQVRLFYESKVKKYLPPSDTRWIYSPAFPERAIQEPEKLYFEIRQSFCCERDLAEARTVYPRFRVVGKSHFTVDPSRDYR